MDCQERGNFLDWIWKEYLNLFQKIIEDQNKKIFQVEEDCVKESSRIHKMYQTQIDLVHKQLEKNTEIKNQALKKHTDLLFEFKYNIKLKTKT